MRTTPQQRIEDHTERGWWNERTLIHMFDEAVAGAPERLALVDQFNRSDFTDGDAQRLSFAGVADSAARLSTALFDAGIRADDIVVVQLPNIAELPLLYIALARLGAIISPVPVQYGQFELDKARDQLDPAAFITLSNFKGRNFAAEHGELFAGGAQRFAFGAAPPAGFLPLSLEAEPAGSEALSDYVDALDTSANDLLSICWTSGTTGQPKGVPRSHNMWKASGRGAHDVAGMHDFEAILNPFPMINMAAIGGFLFPWLMRRATLVLHNPLDLPVFLKQIERESISYTIAPPALLTMLLKQPEPIARRLPTSTVCERSARAARRCRSGWSPNGRQGTALPSSTYSARTKASVSPRTSTTCPTRPSGRSSSRASVSTTTRGAIVRQPRPARG